MTDEATSLLSSPPHGGHKRIPSLYSSLTILTKPPLFPNRPSLTTTSSSRSNQSISSSVELLDPKMKISQEYCVTEGSKEGLALTSKVGGGSRIDRMISNVP